jgi:hypothetical protein
VQQYIVIPKPDVSAIPFQQFHIVVILSSLERHIGGRPTRGGPTRQLFALRPQRMFPRTKRGHTIFIDKE